MCCLSIVGNKKLTFLIAIYFPNRRKFGECNHLNTYCQDLLGLNHILNPNRHGWVAFQQHLRVVVICQDCLSDHCFVFDLYANCGAIWLIDDPYVVVNHARQEGDEPIPIRFVIHPNPPHIFRFLRINESSMEEEKYQVMELGCNESLPVVYGSWLLQLAALFIFSIKP